MKSIPLSFLTLFLALAAHAADTVYVTAIADTDITLSNGVTGTMEKGDCCPFIEYDSSHTMVHLLLVTLTFWTPATNVTFVSKSDTPAAAKKYLAAATQLMAESRATQPEQPPESEATYQKREYEKDMAKLKSAKGEYDRWCALGPAAKESFNQGQFPDAKSFAEELEHLASKYKTDWNYGNAIQDSNLVLGRLALKSGDVTAAKARLLASGRSPGSPQMDSFGPNMSLANDLLAKKEKAVVLEYFELCRKFWEMEEGKLNQWKEDVGQGRTPDFGPNLDY